MEERRMAGEPAANKPSWRSKLTLRNILIAVFVYFGLKGCGVFQFYAPYWGRVLDDETGRPIEGAGVIMHYKKGCAGLAGEGPGPFVGFQADFTDESGDFFLWPRFFIKLPQPICYFKWDPELYVLKERYKVAKLQGWWGGEAWGKPIKAPTSFGRMLFRLKRLRTDSYDYNEYLGDIEDCINDSEKYTLTNDTKKFIEMADSEMEWAIKQKHEDQNEK
jgi:hypothetical protein